MRRVSAWEPGGAGAAGAGRGQVPRVETRLLAAVRAAIARHRLLRPRDRVLAGVSGGPDSVALLHALVLLRPEYVLDVGVCHVHHGLRAEADRDAAFVQRLAARFGCPVTVEHAVVPLGAGRSPEEAARLARYAALERAARAFQATRLALGHTADDQAETVLMRVLQGAGPRGLGGIPMRRGRLVRPLLEVDRATVLAHLSAYDLGFVRDMTNRDPKFLRNRIRHELLPLLAAQGWPRIGGALQRLAGACRETVEALDTLLGPRAGALVEPRLGGWWIDLAPVKDLPPGAAKALLRLAILEVAPADALGGGLRAHHVRALHDLLEAPIGARVRLPRGLLVERARAGLWVAPSTPPAEPVAVAAPGETVFAASGVRLTVEATPPMPGHPADSRWEAWFDSERLPHALAMRHHRRGDRIMPFGGGDPVRVAGMLAAAGVPRAVRLRWPLLVAPGPGGDEVLWVIGVRRGCAAPVTPETTTMLRVRAMVPPEFVAREESL